MIVLDLQIVTPPGKKEALRSEAQRVLGPTRALPGCADCRLLTDLEDDSVLRMISRWESLEHLERHIRSDDFRLVLGMMDLSETAPDVQIHVVERSRGIEELARIREAGHSDEVLEG